MTIYNYHPVTAEFTGATSADESPLEPGAWIVPAHATDIEPVATSENEVAVFDGAEWQVQPDFRGQRAWLATDYDDEEGTEITDIGPLGSRSLTRPAVPPEIQAERDTKAARKVWPTVADFYAEFSTAEKYAIQSSATPSIVVARGDLAMWRGEVWGDHVDVLAGLDAMVEAGVITAERKIEILTKS